MVDVSGKTITARTAVACGRIAMSRDCYEAVKAGAMKKGDVLGVARIAASWELSGRATLFHSAIS